jgi:hypothetical protein
MMQCKIDQLEKENKCLYDVIHSIKSNVQEIKRKMDFLEVNSAWLDSPLKINIPLPQSPLISPLQSPFFPPPPSPDEINIDDSMVDAIACAGGNENTVNQEFSIFIQCSNIFDVLETIVKNVKRYFVHPKKNNISNSKSSESLYVMCECLYVVEFYSKEDKLFTLNGLNKNLKVCSFDIINFFENSGKKEILFLKNLYRVYKSLEVKCEIFNTTAFPFSTLFSICELFSKLKVLKYDMTFVNISIYGNGNFVQLNHTKGNLSLDDCKALKVLFEQLNMFKFLE